MHCAVASVPLCLTLCSFICSAILSVLPCSITNLQTELSLVCEERDRLTQELKRTPELIEKTLSDLREQCEHPYNSQHLIIIHYLFICWVSMLWQCMHLGLPLYILFRWEQTEAAAAGVGAELDGGPAGCGWQRGGRREPAADPGPAGGEQSQPGETPLWAAQPAGAQRAWWGSGCGMTVFQPWLIQEKQTEHSCSLAEMPFITVSTYSHLATPVCLVVSLEQSGIKCSRAPWL